MDLRLFGGFQLFDDTGKPVEIPARKSKALLAWLALHPDKPQPRSRLALLLWEESDDNQARHSLRQALSGLRKALGSHAAALITDQEQVRWDAKSIRVDVQRFDSLLRSRSPQALEAAVALYSGEFLEAFNPRSDGYEEWLMLQRSQYRERAMAAMSTLLDHYLATDQTESGLRLALRLLGSDPLQEQVHRNLMQLYARLNRPADALRQYRRCRRILFRELNVTPEAETERLYREISRQRRLSEEPPAGPPATAPAPTKTAATDEERPTPAGAPDSAQLRPVTVAHLYWVDRHPKRHPEQLHQSTQALVGSIRKLAESFGGHLQYQHADHLALLFGLTTSHGNETDKAVQFALELLARPLPPDHDSDQMVEIRIGIDRGPLLHAGDGVVSGQVLAEAERLARSAVPQALLMSDHAYRGLRLAVDASRHRENVWRVANLRATTPAVASGAPFVGRRRELRLLRTALQTCVEDGLGETFLLRGEAGIGKTRLLEELSRRTDQLAACHRALVLDFGTESQAEPIPSLLRQLLALDETATVETLSAAARGCLGAHWNSTIHRPALHALFRLPMTAGSTEIADPLNEDSRAGAVRQLLHAILERACADRPRLLIIEDIHWASETTLSLVAELATAASRCAALLLITTRIEGEPLDPAWRSAMQGAPLTTVDLTPLGEAQGSALAAELSNGSPEFIEQCVRRSGGNPFLLEQLLWGGDGPGGPLPDSVQSLVLNRLDHLDRKDRQAAQAASVLGQRFRLDALNQMLAGSNYRPDGLLRQGVIRANPEGYLFTHALLREGIYASLLSAQQRALHLRAAEWFHSREPVLYARHLDLAHHRDAASAYLHASRQVVQRLDFEQALSLASRGVEIGQDPALSARLQMQRGELLNQSGAIQEAAEAFQAALNLTDNALDRCRALIGLAIGLTVQDDLDGALDRLECAEPLARQEGDAALLTELHYRRGDILFGLGRADECLEAHRQAERLARSVGSPLLEIRTQAGLGDGFYIRGQMKTAHHHFKRCVELARQQQRLPQELGNLSMCGMTRFYTGSVSDALAAEWESAQLAASYGNLRAEMTAYVGMALIYLYTSEIDKAEQTGRAGLRLARQLGASRFFGDALAAIGEARVLQGDLAAGLDYLERAYRAAVDSVPAHTAAFILGVLARVSPDPKRRQQAITEGQRLLDRGCVSHNHLHFYQNLIEVCLDHQDAAGALHYADRLEQYTAAEPLAWSDFYIRRGRLLAGILRDGRQPSHRTEAGQLLQDAEQAGLFFGVAALEALLTD